MTVRTRTELKAFFETGDVPTQVQYEDLIDSLANLKGDNTFQAANFLFNTAGSTDGFKIKGSENYLVQWTPDNLGMLSNAWLCLNGTSITDPIDHVVAGHNTYMFAIKADVALDPCVIWQGSGGDVLKVYDANVTPQLIFNIDAIGSVQVGVNSSASLRVGKNITSEPQVEITNGQMKFLYNAGAHPLVHVHNNGSIGFSLDATTAMTAVGVKFGISSAGVAGIWANAPGFAGYTETLRVDAATSATDSGLMLLMNGAWKRVIMGAADSGGSGFRELRVAN